MIERHISNLKKTINRTSSPKDLSFGYEFPRNKPGQYPATQGDNPSWFEFYHTDRNLDYYYDFQLGLWLTKTLFVTFNLLNEILLPLQYQNYVDSIDVLSIDYFTIKINNHTYQNDEWNLTFNTKYYKYRIEELIKEPIVVTGEKVHVNLYYRMVG